MQVGLIDLDDEGDDCQTKDVDWRRIHPNYVDASQHFEDDICIIHLDGELDLGQVAFLIFVAVVVVVVVVVVSMLLLFMPLLLLLLLLSFWGNHEYL